MRRDPMDHLIDDLEQVLPEEQEQFPESPSLAEFHYWTDRLLYDRPLTPADLDGTAKRVKADVEDDPGFQDFMRRWREGMEAGVWPPQTVIDKRVRDRPQWGP